MIQATFVFRCAKQSVSNLEGYLARCARGAAYRRHDNSSLRSSQGHPTSGYGQSLIEQSPFGLHLDHRILIQRYCLLCLQIVRNASETDTVLPFGQEDAVPLHTSKFERRIVYGELASPVEHHGGPLDLKHLRFGRIRFQKILGHLIGAIPLGDGLGAVAPYQP